MLANIVQHMSVVEVDRVELDQPISLTNDGDLATVRDLIAAKAPVRVREMFGDVLKRTAARVRSVSKLDPQSLRRVALEVLRQSNPNERVAAIGLGDFTPKQLMSEVERDTVMGVRIVDAVRLNGILVEQAVTSGKIRPKVAEYSELRLPNFDF